PRRPPVIRRRSPRDRRGPARSDACPHRSSAPVISMSRAPVSDGASPVRVRCRCGSSMAKRLKIATFNVNGIRSRLPHLLAWLEKEKPDIACLQELKAVDAAFPIDAVHAAGYGALWQGQTSWNGVAVLARG